jgi:hypothetical protein
MSSALRLPDASMLSRHSISVLTNPPSQPSAPRGAQSRTRVQEFRYLGGRQVGVAQRALAGLDVGTGF